MNKIIGLTKKDLIGINQEIGSNGKFHNESSIDFALSIAKQKKSWLYELSYIIRSVLVDHAFEDGNKRTAIIAIITYFENNNLDYDKDKLIKIVWNMSKHSEQIHKACFEHAENSKCLFNVQSNKIAQLEFSSVSKKNISDINKLMRLIKNAIVP